MKHEPSHASFGRKILVLNISGNVGKSTLSRHLLLEMDPAIKLLSVETVNASAMSQHHENTLNLPATQFKDIFYEIVSSDSIVVDVGASNAAEFISEFTRISSLADEFDYVLVPVTPTEKQQIDTITTLQWLFHRKVNPGIIRIIFNCFDESAMQDIEYVYPTLCRYLQDAQTPSFMWQPHAIINLNEIYEHIKSNPINLHDIARDETDFKAARAAVRKDADAIADLIERQFLRDLAKSASKNLHDVHELIFK